LNSKSFSVTELFNPRAIAWGCEVRVGTHNIDRSRLLRLSCRCHAILLAFLLLGIPAWGQQQATLSGIVRDPSGALIPGASVRVINVDTQVAVTAETNSTGYYMVGNLIPGTYSTEVRKEGFKTAVRPPLTLEVAQSATVDFELELGQTSQEVSVHGTAPLVESTDATVGGVIGPTAMVELPLNGRNYFNLAELSPGVTSYSLRSFYSSAINDYGTSFNSGSAGEDRNGFTLDGADIKQYLINGSYVPSIDAILEFKIETTPYAADLGTSPGAQILLVMKSGTDQFHGDAYEFLRNSSVNAYNYFDNTSLPIPELRKNAFGGTLGGPIVKGKLFFFGSYEGQRERIGETFFGTVPTVLMRQGIFTEVSTPIFNPLTTAPCATCSSGVSRQPFASNTIPSGPSGLISPVSAAYMQSQFPLPTMPGVENNFAANSVDRNTRNQTNLRIDYSRPKDAIFGRYSFNNSGLYAAKQTFGGGSLPGFGDNDVITTSNFTLADAHTFNPTTILQAQVSFLRFWVDLVPQQYGNAVNQKLGIQGVLQNEPFIAGVSGLTNPGSDPWIPEFRADNQYSYVAKLTKVAGRQTFHVGAEFDRWQVFMNAAPAYPEGDFNFDGSFTKDPNNTANTGFPFADFLLGYPVFAQAQVGYSGGYLFRNNVRWWLNDEWRITPNLTLNLGVRYEFDGPFSEKHDKLSNFDPSTGQLILAGQNGVSNTAGVKSDLDNYAPRFGFAYSLPGHHDTVLRGGYGIFYDVEQENCCEGTRTNPPYSYFSQFLGGNTTAELPTVPLQDALSASRSSPPVPYIQALDLHLQNGYQQQASFGIQHQFGSSLVAEVDYNWQKNTKFFASRNLDAPLQHGTYVLPYPQFSGITYLTNLEYGNYNAMLARFEKRLSHGLTATTSFTWSKYLDNTTGGNAAGAPGDPGFQNPYCFSCDYGRSTSDFEKRFVQSWVYKVSPPNWGSAFAKNAVGGWEISGIFTYQSGFPVSPRISYDNSETETYADRPDVVPGVPLFPAGTRNPALWFNRAAFTPAPPLQFGNAGKGIIDGPNLIVLDAAVMRNFKLTERFNLQFRAEGFNLPNHPNFADPNPYIDQDTAGAIYSTATTSRQLQFALKLIF
jgi:hypothetical protein